MKHLVKKVLIYCLRQDRLLVFRHLDFSLEEVGVQVPGGTVRGEESITAAALRELEEETGYRGFVIGSYLGHAFYDLSPYRSEIQERSFFTATAPETIADRWIGAEEHDGAEPTTRFEFFWIPLEQGHVLQSGQGALLGSIQDVRATRD